MRWFRCDLQVQTPEDGRHWAPDDPLRLGSSRTEQDMQEKARRYLRRCHEAGLDVIGVTDHNFCSHRQPRQRFLAHLIEQNRSVAEEMGRSPLWIFPGFELDIGFHVLCLFPPVKKASGLDDVCDVLTKLGLPPNERFGTSGPTPLRRDGQYVSLAQLLRTIQDDHQGLVIAAHAFEQDGICSDARHAGDYRNEELLCVEVSGPALRERERAVLEAREGAWGRSRPPAHIRSSDAKSILTEPDGNPKPNSIGYRWTWIKISEPSIEALRQAFLDPKSRVRLDGDPRIVRQGRILSLAVQGAAFLANQEVVFSPNLNCLIGGRGSGKSSLFEYIRFTVRKEDDLAAAEQVQRIRATLTPASRLVLRWREGDSGDGSPGPEDVFEFDLLATARARVISRDVLDPSTIFRNLGIQMFSQRQITEIGREPSFLLPLIDSLAGEELQRLERQEREVREEVQRLQQQQRILSQLLADRNGLEQTVQELDRRWKAQSALQEEQARHRYAQEAQQHLEDLVRRADETAERFTHQAEDLVESHSPLGSAVSQWPEGAFFQALDQEVERSKELFASEVKSAAERYKERIRGLTSGSPEWARVQEAIRTTEEQFLAACARQGLKPEDLDQLRQLNLERKAKSLDLERVRAQVAEAERSMQAYEAKLERLHALWREQTETRKRKVREVLEGGAIPRVDGDRPSLEVRIEYLQDRDHFLAEWRELTPDGRSRLGRQWDEIGEKAFETFSLDPVEGRSPWQVLESWVRGKVKPSSHFGPLIQELERYLASRAPLWELKALIRIRDGVDLVLYRQDGSEAGSLGRKQLSEGQRNTALLMLLLASGGGPILIDQPEDELDSNFIFSQLVPLLREIKNERQVIVVTHNPNLPVNGDAELVYALQAEASPDGGARGVVRAEGGLDREAVKQAVLDIMEGSEEAFLKRREKYHF